MMTGAITAHVAWMRGDARWPRLVAALERSAALWAPDVRLEVLHELPVARENGGVRRRHQWAANTAKLEHWSRCVAETPDGARALVLDADTLILGPLAEAFTGTFDVALTHKGDVRPPINAGVVFYRGGAAARAFFARWVALNAQMMHDPDLFRRYHMHVGVNQASLAALLDEPHDATVAMLPAARWNACTPALWRGALDCASIVHYKGPLRLALFQTTTRGAPVELVQLWRDVESGGAPQLRPLRDADLPAHAP